MHPHSRLVSRRSARICSVFVALAWQLAGCDSGDPASADAQAVDGGLDAMTVDARPVDARPVDAADARAADATSPDRGPPDAAPDATPDAALPPLDPPATFDRYCGEALPLATAASLGPAAGGFVGGYQGLPIGTWQTVKVVPTQPFRVRAIQAAFAGGEGQATFHLTESFGRSYPAREAPLMRPIQIGVEAPDPEVPIVIELDEPVYLEPSQHYILSYQIRAQSPVLAVESAPAGEIGWSLIHVPDEDTPYGVANEDGTAANFRMSLIGDTFCELAAPSFVQRVPEAIAQVASARVSIADLDGDGHEDVVLNDGGARAFLSDGRLGLREAPLFPVGNRAAMTVFGDLDNDGDVDAFAPTYAAPDADDDDVRLEEGDCDDTDPAVRPGVAEVQGNQKDDDCDGLVDAQPCVPAVEVQNGRDEDCDGRADETFANGVWLNDGVFTPVANPGFGGFDPTGAAALGDTDGDGILDAYWGNWLLRYPNPPAEPDHFVRGLGDGTFEERTEAAGLYVNSPRACYGAVFTDYDDDGQPDLWVGNYGYGENALWHNQGDGTFIDRAPALGAHRDGQGRQGGNTYGAAVGDVDQDGDVDFYVPNIAHPRFQPWSDPSHLMINQGPDTPFTLQREEVGLVFDEGDVNAAFGDYDNDGDLDLAVASLYTTHFSRLYRNEGAVDGQVRWTDVTWETGTAVHDAVTAVWADLDEDGDLELLIADRAGLPQIQIFQNQAAAGNHWISFDLQGTVTNRSAVGARVTLTAGGRTQIRDITGGGGHANAQGTRFAHFGLGAADRIERLTVRWVGGATEEFAVNGVDQRILLVEGAGR